MLKLVKQPRSRRERGRWRATPGRSEEDSAPPPPAEDPSDRTLGCVPRVRGCAHAGCLGRASPGNPAALALETPREPTAAAGVVGRARASLPRLLWRRLENGLAAVTVAPENYGSHRAECWVF